MQRYKDHTHRWALFGRYSVAIRNIHIWNTSANLLLESRWPEVSKCPHMTKILQMISRVQKGCRLQNHVAKAESLKPWTNPIAPPHPTITSTPHVTLRCKPAAAAALTSHCRASHLVEMAEWNVDPLLLHRRSVWWQTSGALGGGGSTRSHSCGE